MQYSRFSANARSWDNCSDGRTQYLEEEEEWKYLEEEVEGVEVGVVRVQGVVYGSTRRRRWREYFHMLSLNKAWYMFNESMWKYLEGVEIGVVHVQGIVCGNTWG